jgi:cytochrome P450
MASNMHIFSQSPTDLAFVQNPYPVYDKIRGDCVYWQDYEMPTIFSYSEIDKLFKNKLLGREAVNLDEIKIPKRLQPFYDIEAHSMLELEPPRHTHLRKMVLHAFTSRRIAALGPEIENLCDRLIDNFPNDPFDILSTYADAGACDCHCKIAGCARKHDIPIAALVKRHGHDVSGPPHART